MNRRWLVSMSVVAAMGAPALADISFADTAVFNQFDANPPPGIVTGGLQTNVSADDGAEYAISLTGAGTANPWTFHLVSTWSTGVDRPWLSSSVFLFLQTVSLGPNLIWEVTGAQWYVAASPGTSATLNTVTAGSPFAITAAMANTNPRLTGSENTANWTTAGGFVFGTTIYDSLDLTLRIRDTTGAVTTDPGGSVLGFDAIANPEPGTMALFGLGALGLGGFAWRRRRAAKAAAAKA
jgi:hypothetical protein